jgi:hypothetical protein
MSANILVPNDYYTIYCKKLVASDTPITSAETWCYYPSNPSGQGQVITDAVSGTLYPISYNVSAISKNVVVNDDGSIDVVQSGIYRLEVQYSLSFTGVSNPSFQSVTRRDGSSIYVAPSVSVTLANSSQQSVYYSIFFTINQGNTTPVKLTTFIFSNTGITTGNLNILGACLSLQRIDEAPTPP